MIINYGNSYKMNEDLYEKLNACAVMDISRF